MRFRTAPPTTVAERAAEGASTTSSPPRVERQSVLLDTVHDDRVALGADLERRLGGELLSCAVTEVDYVEGTTRCDVRFRPAGPANGAERTDASRAAPADPTTGRLRPEAIPAGGVR
ncbi:MAG: hypothetical protein GEU88_20255 [Solirubrobacterales bacterium]|nr:hypothetical protein [Solirubrobacterales bacterium]